MKKLLIVALSFFCVISCVTKKKSIIANPQFVEKSLSQVRSNSAKNVIFMIGDGMGLSQISAGLYSNNNKLHLERPGRYYRASSLVSGASSGPRRPRH